MRLDEAAWAGIRHALLESDESKVSIAKRFGISVDTLDRRATKEGWQRPHKLRQRRAEPGEDPATVVIAARRQTKPTAPVSESPEARLARMLGLVDVQLEKLERRMTSGDGTTPQDEERDIRTLNATIGCLERITEVGTELAKTRAAAGGPAAGARETERLRREIAERLERLNAQWLAHDKPR